MAGEINLYFDIHKIMHGEHDGGNGQAGLTDSGGDFVNDGVEVGHTVWNLTDESSGTVSARTATTITATLSGGTDNDWDNGDEYYVVGPRNAQTVNCKDIIWGINYGTSNFTPAVLRVLGALFGDETIPNFIVYFGKFTETITFEVNFATDADWKSFRKWSTQSAYFDTELGDAPLRFYWGDDPVNDKFFDYTNDVAKLKCYEGMFGMASIHKNVTGGFWEGTINFMIGVVVQL
jgi:hypothetical protein